MAKNIGLMPGSLVYTGEKWVDNVQLTAITFNEDANEVRDVNIDELSTLVKPNQTLWLNIVGLHDIDLIKKIGEVFQVHNLELEDILNVNQRPSFDEYEDQFFVATKMFRVVKEAIVSEQFSMVVGEGFLLTFQEREGDVFDGVRARIQAKKGRIRSRKSDYLAFALLDVIVDHYMVIIEEYGEEINDQESRLMETIHSNMIQEINLIKKEVNYLRRFTRPLRDVVINFGKSEHNLIEDQTRPFLKDLNDHITHVSENIEIYRETINDNVNTYHTHMANKLNDILKVLTVFSVIFIPLTFMAGIYGMNFEHMPELGYEYAYPIFWGALIIVALSMVFFFRSRKWL